MMASYLLDMVASYYRDVVFDIYHDNTMVLGKFTMFLDMVPCFWTHIMIISWFFLDINKFSRTRTMVIS